MRLTNLSILFCMVFLVFALRQDVESEQHTAMAERLLFYNQVMDSAVMDAAWKMAVSDDGALLEYSREKVVRRFYDSLYLGTGVMEDPYKKQELARSVPVLILLENDGFYVAAGENGEGVKYFYEKDYGEWKVTYQVNGLVQVEKDEGGFYQMGTYQDLAFLLNVPEWESYDSFEEERRKVITRHLSDCLNETMNGENEIAGKAGSSYLFQLPVVEQEDWYRTIDHPGVFAVYQGYPFGLSGEKYERIAVAGARLVKRQW